MNRKEDKEDLDQLKGLKKTIRTTMKMFFYPYQETQCCNENHTRWKIARAVGGRVDG